MAVLTIEQLSRHCRQPSLRVPGAGYVLREFLHVDDLGEACVFALERWQPGPDALQFLNVGTGVDLSICELAEQVAAATGFRGMIQWDASKPDGTPKKQLDVSRLAELGWRARISLAEGLATTVAGFRQGLKTSGRASSGEVRVDLADPSCYYHDS